MYPLLKFLKVLSVAMLFTGTAGAFFARAYEDRRRFAFQLAGPGFGLTWAVGYGLTQVQGVSLLSTYILVSMVLSLFSVQVVLWSVGKDGRRGPIGATLALSALVGVAALMIWKP